MRRPGIANAAAVVTGASRGIGAAIACELARQGARVILSGRDVDALDRLVATVRDAGGEAFPVPADVTVEADIAHLADQTLRLVGPPGLLAIVAGGQGAPVSLADLTAEQWRQTIDSNLTSTYLTLRAFVPGMSQRGAGAVVAVSSTAGRATSPASPAYGAAKAGQLMLLRQVALEVAGSGVRVNAIAPGATPNQRMRDAMTAEALDRLARLHPLGRLGTPEDMAAAAVFLLSDDASWITGATLDVNGGRLML